MLSVRPTSRPTGLISIQVLRALAALTVVIHHAGYDADTIARRDAAVPLDLDRFVDLTFGIHVFFVISGFIMVRSARGFGQPGSPWRFMLRRVLRVVPLYWLTTSLVLVGALLAPGLLNSPVNGWPLFFGSYLFVPVMRASGEIRPILGQGWTLNYEMFFYVLFAGTMVLPRRLALLALAVGLLALVAVGKVFRPNWPPGAVWTDGLLLEFLLGMLVGLLSQTGLRLNRWAAISIVLVGVGAAVGLGPWTSRFDALDLWIREGVPAALIVAGCVFGPAWAMGSAVLAFAMLGDASYSLYLTHPFVIRLMRAGWSASIGMNLPVWWFVAGSCAAAIGVAILVFSWIELPITRYLHRRFAESEAGVRPCPAPESAPGPVP